MSLAQILRENRQKTGYKQLAKKHNTNYSYVAAIASGQRVPIRGKGLLIKRDLEKLANESPQS